MSRLAHYAARHYDALKSIFGETVIRRLGIHKDWAHIDGWFTWRMAQEEAVKSFPDGSRFIEVGTYLGRSLCSLGEVVQTSGKHISLIGIDTCRGSGPEGWRGKDYHASAVAAGEGTFAGELHKNILDCGLGDSVQLIIAESVNASRLFPDASLEWVHLDARHDYRSVKADIEAWLPKLRIGGWLSGDDYDREKWPEVVRAVEELLPGAKSWCQSQWRWVVE